MSNINRKICRLCLQSICENNFDRIEEITKNMLDVLLLKLNLEISIEPIMCNECATYLQQSFDFKLASLNKNDMLFPFGYSNKQDDKKCVKVFEYGKLCQICMKTTKQDSSPILHESKENVFIFDVLHKHISELNFNIPEQMVMCANCLGSLQVLLRLVTKCLDVEEKIRKYVESEQTTHKGQIELGDVQQFTFNEQIKGEVEMTNCTTTDGLKIEKVKIEKIDGNPEEITEEITVKDEVENLTEIDAENFRFERHNNEAKVEQDYSKCFGEIAQSSSTVLKNIHKCTECMFETKYKNNLARHIAMHKSRSEIKTYKCTVCSYESKRKQYFNTHMLLHKDPSEVPMFKCEVCSYATIYKHYINVHMKVHKNPEEINMYACDSCSYKAKYKRGLKSHMLRHKKPEELPVYQCTVCTYEANRKYDLNKHMLVHKNSSEVTMNRCSLCSYKTKYKDNLKQHVKIHKTCNEVTMFNCELCDYQSKFKSRIKNHMKVHKNPEELTMFQCHICSFKTKYKKNLRIHMLQHFPAW